MATRGSKTDSPIERPAHPGNQTDNPESPKAETEFDDEITSLDAEIVRLNAEWRPHADAQPVDLAHANPGLRPERRLRRQRIGHKISLLEARKARLLAERAERRLEDLAAPANLEEAKRRLAEASSAYATVAASLREAAIAKEAARRDIERVKERQRTLEAERDRATATARRWQRDSDLEAAEVAQLEEMLRVRAALAEGKA